MSNKLVGKMVKFCPNCNIQQEENYNFCTKCGSELKNQETSEKNIILPDRIFTEPMENFLISLGGKMKFNKLEKVDIQRAVILQKDIELKISNRYDLVTSLALYTLLIHAVHLAIDQFRANTMSNNNNLEDVFSIRSLFGARSSILINTFSVPLIIK